MAKSISGFPLRAYELKFFLILCLFHVLLTMSRSSWRTSIKQYLTSSLKYKWNYDLIPTLTVSDGSVLLCWEIVFNIKLQLQFIVSWKHARICNVPKWPPVILYINAAPAPPLLILWKKKWHQCINEMFKYQIWDKCQCMRSNWYLKCYIYIYKYLIWRQLAKYHRTFASISIIMSTPECPLHVCDRDILWPPVHSYHSWYTCNKECNKYSVTMLHACFLLFFGIAWNKEKNIIYLLFFLCSQGNLLRQP